MLNGTILTLIRYFSTYYMFLSFYRLFFLPQFLPSLGKQNLCKMQPYFSFSISCILRHMTPHCHSINMVHTKLLKALAFWYMHHLKTIWHFISYWDGITNGTPIFQYFNGCHMDTRESFYFILLLPICIVNNGSY